MVPTVRLFSEQGTRSALVSAEPSFAEKGAWLIRVAIKQGEPPSGTGTEYGPFPAAELEARMQEVVGKLRAQGYEPAGLGQSLAALKHPSRRQRALLALRLGRRRCREAVPALLAAAEGATDEICSILDALGEIGDARALPLVRKYATRKLLSRRRSGVEALRRLGDKQALAEVLEQLEQRLEPSLKAAVTALGDPDDLEQAGALVEAVKSLPGKRRGRAADALYELGSPVTVEAARTVLDGLHIERANVWRYAKSVLKRAQLRADWTTMGRMAHRIESLSRETTGQSASVRSGRDGKTRETVIFGRNTQRYLLRSVWRHLRDLARYRPHDYPAAAAAAIIDYRPEDAQPPRARYGALASCYLLNRVLWSAGPRLEYNDRRLRFRFRSSADTKPLTQEREEPYPELWDAWPGAYLDLLAAAKLPEVQAFAVRAVRQRHPQLLTEAAPAQLHGMVACGYQATIELALAELDRRFDPLHPDWDLIRELADSELGPVRTIACDWLRRCAPLWTVVLERALDLLTSARSETRAAVAEMLLEALPAAPSEYRQQLAEQLCQLVSDADKEPDDLAACAQVAADGLAAEIAQFLTLEQVLTLIEQGSEVARSLGGAVLAQRSETLAEIGLERVLHLAQHQVSSVRAAALALIRGHLDLLRQDPSLLFVLAESEWDDTRNEVLRLLADEFTISDLGAAGVIGLCDSNQIAVQNLGQEMVTRYFKELDPGQLVQRLVEHPHANMHRFVMGLIEQHLGPGAEALARVEPFMRSVLLSLQPSRELKRRAFAFLTRRGEADVDEARLAAKLLGAVVHTKGQADFEQTLVALARLTVAWPELPTCLARPEAVA